MSQHFDLIVIGAGMAGVAAATKCATRGWQVAIVDSLPYGGTCALRGCDPKKILRRGAEIIDSARLMRGKGIDDAQLTISWPDLMRHKHGFTDPVPESMEESLTDSGVTTLHGQATFTGHRRLEIDGVPYDADHFLVATGARPRPLDFPGHEHLIDSTDFMDLAELPSRVVFVGGGFISFEFAHIAARAGSSPVIIDRGKRPLKGFDPDLVELLVDHGRQVGIGLHRATTIVDVQPSDDGYQVTVEHAGEQEKIESDLVVHGAGRVAELADLGLDAAGVNWGEHGITVTGHLQSTTNSHVWAAGDSADTEGMPLTPVAVTEAKVAASNMLKNTTTAPDYAGIPHGRVHHPGTHPRRDARVRSLGSGHRRRRPVQRHQRLVLQLPHRRNHCRHQDPHRPDKRPDRRRAPPGPRVRRTGQYLRTGHQTRPHHPSAAVHDSRLPHHRVRPGLDTLQLENPAGRAIPGSATGTATNPERVVTASVAGDSTTDWAALNLGPALPRRQRLAARLVVIEVVVEDHDADTPVTLHRITEQCALVDL